MARVTFLNAIVSGKVGGGVYAHNKAGSYIRILRKPTNPRSIAQVQARSCFGSGSNLWRACTSAQKAAYNTFATNSFNPLNAKPGVMYSGNQAAGALNTACIAANLLIRTTVLKIATITSTATYGTFGGNTNPPAYRLAGQIDSSTHTPLNCALGSATVTTSGTATMIITTDNLISAAPTFNNTGQTEKLGFGLYMSNPFTTGQNFVTNKYHTFLGSTGTILTATATIVTPKNGFEIDFTGTEFIPANHKTWITVGNKVRLSAVIMSVSGQLIDIGSVDFTVVA